MGRKSTKINVTKLRGYLAKRKVKNVGRAIMAVNAFKDGAKDSR